MVNVTINGTVRAYQTPVTFEQLAREHQKEYDHPILLAIADHKIKELYKNVTRDARISFLTMADRIGMDTYVRSACMLLMKAVCDVAGSPRQGAASMEYAIKRGYFCAPGKELAKKVLFPGPDGSPEMDPVFAGKVKARMRRLVEEDIPIMKRAYPTEEAIALFRDQGMDDKVRLFRYRRGSYINVYSLDGYYDYNYGYMVPSTGYLKYFDLIPYKSGLMLLLPHPKEPEKVPVFEPREKLFATMEASGRWGKKLGIETVGDLNDEICRGNLPDLILVQEASQERRIGEIAGDIVSRGNVKFVMIAGPSSSGKTTFSHRLSIQLRTHGLTPHPIAVDDYFVNRDQTPRDEKGNFNFECLEAIDVEQFNRDMTRLLAGERVELPSFNFKTGQREYRENYLQLGKDDILVIEGIHGLNDALSYSLPLESKYKVYISALTCLNVDDHNRIATTDGRLIRRLVRDARTRGTSALRTLRMWESGRTG